MDMGTHIEPLTGSLVKKGTLGIKGTFSRDSRETVPLSK
jgi:hypothetical protein